MKKILLILLLVPQVIFSDNNSNRYGVESGYYEMESENFYGKSKSIIYFQDYGNKIKTESEGLGFKMTIIVNGNKTITLNHVDKTYFEDISDEYGSKIVSEEQYLAEGELIGEEVIAGKLCKIIRNIDVDNTEIKIWIWKNIVFRQEINTSEADYKTSSEIVEIDFKKEISSDVFEIPRGYTKNQIDLQSIF